MPANSDLVGQNRPAHAADAFDASTTVYFKLQAGGGKVSVQADADFYMWFEDADEGTNHEAAKQAFSSSAVPTFQVPAGGGKKFLAVKGQSGAGTANVSQE